MSDNQDIIVRRAGFVSADDEIYAEKIENGSIYEGELTIDTLNGKAEFAVGGDLELIIENCSNMNIDEYSAVFINDFGTWEFEFFEEDA